MTRLTRAVAWTAPWGAAALLLLAASPAQAVPSYSRRYGIACTSCHTMWGSLNGAGVTFRLSGYRAINGRDLKPIDKDVEVGNGALAFPGTLPASVIAGVGYDSRTEVRRDAAGVSSTANGSSLTLSDSSIFLTAPIGKHLSVFTEFPMYETRAFEFTPTGPAEANAHTRGNVQFASERPVFEVAKFWWNSVLPESMAPRDSVNLLFGITHLPTAYAAGKVRLSVNQYLVYERRGIDLISPAPVDDIFVARPEAQDGLFRLSEPQVMAEVNGMLVAGDVTAVGKRETLWFEYHLGVTNGTNAQADTNSQKDLYGRAVFRWYNQSLGFFAFSSANTYGDDMRAGGNAIVVAGRPFMAPGQFHNAVFRAGPDATLSLAPLGAPLWLENNVLYNEEKNPTGYDKAFTWWGGFHQLNWQINKTAIAYGRYDWLSGRRFDDTAAGGITVAKPTEWDVVLGAQFLVIENFKVTGEYRHRVFEDQASQPQVARLTEDGFTIRTSIGY